MHATIIPFPTRAPAVLPARRRRPITDALNFLLLWIERASQRRQLAALPDAALKDIGISRAECFHECRKPFWRV